MENKFKDFIIETVNEIMKPNVIRKDLMEIITENIIKEVNSKINKMQSDVLNIKEDCIYEDSSLDLCHYRNFGGEGNICKWCIDLEKLFYEQE